METEQLKETPLKDLDSRIQKQVDNAQRAMERGNASYAIDICFGILSRFPACLDVRKMLRKAQQKARGGKSQGMTKFIRGVTNVPFQMGGAKMIKNDPLKAMEAAEKQLNSDPHNAAAHRMLGEAAKQAGLHETQVFAYETIRLFEPENVENLIALTRALMDAGRPEEAVKVIDAARKKDPANAVVDELSKDANVAFSMKRGKWEEEGDFRDKLKDEEEAVELESANRVMNDEESLMGLVKRDMKRLEAQPENIMIFKEISAHYKAMKKFDEAIEWIEKARELPKGKADTTLERAIVDLTVAKYRKTMLDAEAKLEETPDDAEAKKTFDDAKKALHAFRIKQLQDLVERYPNDNSYQFEYGELLFDEGRYDEAAEKFQKATRAPALRLKAMLYLGKAFKATKKLDLARDQLATAKSETPVFDNFKKEVIYELADCFEQMGDKDKAMGEYKVIYSNDMGYRDVAVKINEFYSQQAS